MTSLLFRPPSLFGKTETVTVTKTDLIPDLITHPTPVGEIVESLLYIPTDLISSKD